MLFSAKRSGRLAFLAIGLAAAVTLSGCGTDGVQSEQSFPKQVDRNRYDPGGTKEREAIFGTDGLKLLGGTSEGANTGSGLGVNSFLWRASLDTLSFMPLQSADPFGGVIITDWYADPQTPRERFKMNVYILDRALRADGIKVTVFKQAANGRGGWTDAGVNQDVAVQLENAILVRARQLKINTLGED